jgi:hypothetical protein
MGPRPRRYVVYDLRLRLAAPGAIKTLLTV